MPLPNITLSKDSQFVKVFLKIPITLSGIVTLFSEVHLLKADSPMLFTLFPIVMFFKAEQF